MGYLTGTLNDYNRMDSQSHSSSTHIKVIGNKILKALNVPGWKDWTEHKPIKIYSIEKFIQEHAGVYMNLPNTKTLDLGCGSNPKNPFKASILTGVDIKANIEIGIASADLCLDSIPFEDNLFVFVTAHDFIEHIPRVIIVDRQSRFSFVELMNEIFRVLKPGGLFYSQTPAYPAGEAFQDPTHVNIITEKTCPLYFCVENYNEGPLARCYGFKGNFNFIAQDWCYPSLQTIIQKPKILQ